MCGNTIDGHFGRILYPKIKDYFIRASEVSEKIHRAIIETILIFWRNSKTFKKDKTMAFLGNDKEKKEEDMVLFEKVLEDMLVIFWERRKMYGNHLKNAKRFPHENISGIYLKCTRLIRMFESGEELDQDTLIDTAIYACLILSARKEN